MSPEVKSVLQDAIDALDEHQSSSGCNDYHLPDTPEIRQLWKEFNQWNCPGCDSPEHPQWIPLSPARPGDESMPSTLVGNDGFQIFLLKKHIGIL